MAMCSKLEKPLPTELEKIIAEGGRKGEIYQNLKNIRDEYSEEIKKGIPDIPRRVSGYNLDELLPKNDFNVARALSGTESTCVIYLEVTLRLITELKNAHYWFWDMIASSNAATTFRK